MERRIIFQSSNNTKKLPCSGHSPEEIEIFRKAREGDPEYSAYVVLKNMGLAYSAARHFYQAMGAGKRAIDLEDLIQEAALGLMAAKRKFEYWRGIRFSTYASWWIFAYLTKYVKRQGYAIHIPGNLSAMANRYQREMQESNGQGSRTGLQNWYEKNLRIKRKPSLELIVKAKKNMGANVFSSDEALNNLPELREGSVVDEVDKRLGMRDVRAALQALPRRHRRVMEIVYGLNPEALQRHTFSDAGIELAKEGLGKGAYGSESICHEMVRVLHRQALLMLRNALHVNGNGNKHS